LAEPLKVALNPDGGYLVIDGALRLRAIRSIREQDQSRFARISAYLLARAAERSAGRAVTWGFVVP
jgi:hypothetical protein